MSKYLAIDPGNVTGAVFIDTDSDPDNPFRFKIEIPGGLYGAVDWWQGMVGNHVMWVWGRPDYVFVEDFIVNESTHKKTREPAAYEALGWVKGKCHEAGLPCMVIGAGEHKTFSAFDTKSESKIVRLGWSEWTKDNHIDAAISLLVHGLKRVDPGFINPYLERIATSV